MDLGKPVYGEDAAWGGFVVAARTMCEMAGAGLYVVHLEEMPPRIEVVHEVGSGEPADIIQAAEESRERARAKAASASVNQRVTAGAAGARGFSWCAARALVIAAERGEPVLRWAESELGRFRELARGEAAIDALGEGLVVIDGAQRVVHCTRRAAELLGLGDGSEVESRPAREVIPDAVDELEPHEVVRGVLGKAQVTYLAHQPAPAVGESEPRPGLVLRLRSEARFLATRRGRLQLLAALRHDVRSPLTALRGLVGVLQEEPDMPEGERQQLLELLRQEAERTVTWVEDYLILLRLRFEPRPSSPASMPIDAPLRALESQYAEHARERGVVFVVDAERPGAGGPTIEGDATLIDAFCKNLVGHFLRLADAGATVTTRLELDGTLVVEGYGPGLFAQHPANPFTTLARSTAAGKRTPGVGLGLFLAKKVADVHGWPIRIACQDGVVRAEVRWAGRGG